ncbi:YceI family protein [Aurantibacter crassamenti]|uniref:YceI family protein n=1 Tax=Aurantibacter crassamenti TaxID=1837375 RepID=UPI001939BEBF|nr:YceI family protein [Aurantibacter crassamenti]MBM1105743.1 YceI family protein [Aurantibacter crassamenti]
MKKIVLILLVLGVTITGFAQDSYTLSNNSKLTIDGTSTVHDWTVTANTLKGSLKADADSPKEIDFQVAVADIKSERGATMDKKMHAALQKDSHPQVLFNLIEVKDKSTLVGTLTIGGNSQKVEITGKLDVSTDKISITGEHGLALKDYEIEPPTAMFGQVIVGPDVTVKFNLVFTKE